MPARRLLLFILRDLQAKGFTLHWETGLENCDKGYTDDETRRVVVDPEQDDWLETLCHEHGHACQQWESTDLWRAADPEMVELDAEARAWTTLRRYGLLVGSEDSDRYIRAARLFALSHREGLDEELKAGLVDHLTEPLCVALMPSSWTCQISDGRMKMLRKVLRGLAKVPEPG